MSKKNIALIVSGVLLILGIFIATAGGLLHGRVTSIFFNSDGIHTSERNEDVMTKQLSSFKNIDVSTDSIRIELIKSDRNEIEYVVHDQQKVSVCDVIDDTLTFKTNTKFTLMMFSFEESYVKIYYKDDNQLENVSLQTTSGSVYVNDVNAKKLVTKSTSGAQNISNIVANDFTVNGTSGSIKLNNVNCDEVSVENTSGSIKVDDITSKNIYVKNTSGSIKLYDVNSNKTTLKGTSGSIYLQGELKGKTQVKNTSGSVRVHTSLPKSDYGYSLSTTSGSTKVNDETFKGSTGDIRENFIDAAASSGSVKIYFDSLGK